MSDGCVNCRGNGHTVVKKGHCADCGRDLREEIRGHRRSVTERVRTADALKDMADAYIRLAVNSTTVTGLLAEDMRRTAEELCRLEDRRAVRH